MKQACLVLLWVGLVWGQIDFFPPRAGTGGPGGGANASASSVSAVTSLVVDVSALNAASTNQFIYQCRQTVSPFGEVAATMNPATLTSVTLNFASTPNIVCTINATGTGPAGAAGATGATGPAGANGAISQLQDEGSGLTVRPTINFTGAGVTATDDAGNNRTNVTISATGGGHVIEDNGTPVTQRDALNFISGSGISLAFADSSSPSRTSLTPSLDTTIAATRTRVTQGDDQFCVTTGSGTAFVCAPASGTAYPGYTNGARFLVRVHANCGATPTINMSSLGAKRLYAADGTSDPSCTAGQQYWLSYNETLDSSNGGWVFPASGGGGGTNPTANGLQSWNGSAWDARSLVSANVFATVTNANGTGGNPTITVAPDDFTWTTPTQMRDDFCGGDLTRSISVGSTFGLLTWRGNAISTQTGANTDSIAVPESPCGLAYVTPTVDNAGGSWTTNSDGANNRGGSPFVNTSTQTGWRVWFPIRMSANTSVGLAVGFGKRNDGFNPQDCLVATTFGCVAVIADTDVGSNFHLRTCNTSGTCTTTDMGLAFAADTNYLISITSTSAGQITATINGANSTTNTTNAPNIPLGPHFAAVSRDTSSRTIRFYGFGFRGGTSVF